MTSDIKSFVDSIPNVEGIKPSHLIDYFVYYVTIVRGGMSASPFQIEQCFENAQIAPYSNISQYLSKNSTRNRGRKPKFLTKVGGYVLERSHQSRLEQVLQKDPIKRKTAHSLKDLVPLLVNESEREFLKEAVNCYEVGAYRAAIIMTWILSLDHLFEYILAHKLSDFNALLSDPKYRSLKVKRIGQKDDFSDIKETTFIEICCGARIISRDVKKILNAKLDIRNSSAHPSGIKVKEPKATDFIQDLVENVVLKYRI